MKPINEADKAIYRQRAIRAQSTALTFNKRFDWMLAAEYWKKAGDLDNEKHCRAEAKKCSS
jgi:hypothetical protein